MLSTGVDILHVPRMKTAIERYGQRLLDRCFTKPEIASCRGFVEEFAVRYAAKEAVSKALGVGLRIMSPLGVKFHDVEILPDRFGKPHVHLHGWAAQRAQAGAGDGRHCSGAEIRGRRKRHQTLPG